MTNSPLTPDLNPDMESLLLPEYQHRHIVYTQMCEGVSLNRLNGVYDHFVRNGIAPDSQIVPGMPRTNWISDIQGVRCTQIVTGTQIISLDFHYDATCYLNEFYSPEKPLPVGKMLGLWTRDLFEMKLPFGGVVANQRLTPPPDVLCAVCDRNANTPFDLAHVSPYCYDGEQGEKQWMCAHCNHNRSVQLQGVRLDGTPFCTRQCLTNLLSEFSSDVYHQLVLDTQTRMGDFRTVKPLMSRERYEAIRDDENLYFDSVDCKKQYATCAYTAEHRWPQFSKLDSIEPFDGQLAPGVFFVQQFHGIDGFDDCSWEGPRFYLESWCDYHLNETQFITKNDISKQCKASFSYPPDMFRP